MLPLLKGFIVQCNKDLFFCLSSTLCVGGHLREGEREINIVCCGHLRREREGERGREREGEKKKTSLHDKPNLLHDYLKR